MAMKREEICAKEYRDLEDLRISISRFIETYYNERRLHSALGYQTPAEFEEIRKSRSETGREVPDRNCPLLEDICKVSRVDLLSDGFGELISTSAK